MRGRVLVADFSVARRRCRLRVILPPRPTCRHSRDFSPKTRAMRFRRTESGLLQSGIRIESCGASG